MQKRITYNPDLLFIKQEWSGNPLNIKNQYVNLDGPSEKTFRELLKWQTQKNPLKSLKKKQQTNIEVISNQTFIKDNEAGFTWLGHACFMFTLSGRHFITDPILYNLGPIKRYTPLPCNTADLKNIDFILLSHNHRDHCDKKSMQELCTLNPEAVILTGLSIAPLLRRWKIKNIIIEAGWYQQYKIETDVTVTYLPARHWNRRGLSDMNEMLWGSFMIENKKQKIYFGADSGLGIHFEEIGNLFSGIDYAVLGIGAYQPEWFMAASHTSPAGALEAFRQLKAKYFIPMHHGTFDLSDEPVFYPKQELIELTEKQNINNVLHLNIGKKHFI
jgi:L-ascorbate metabolism protein UlaG (beta-lactamase superfamily)